MTLNSRSHTRNYHIVASGAREWFAIAENANKRIRNGIFPEKNITREMDTWLALDSRNSGDKSLEVHY